MRLKPIASAVLLASVPVLGFAQTSSMDAGERTFSLEEITVTAQRRTERLVDVPISVNVFDQQELELKKVDSVLDLSKVTTNLRFESNAPSYAPTLRGIGSSVQGAGVDANVPVYVDGFYLANNYGMSFDLPNIESVQILKGPQGTLFGRNATGGAILVTTREPSSEATGRFKVSYGSYDDIRTQAYLSGPLTDSIAAGVSIYYRESSGYFDNVVTGADDDGRLEMLNIRPDIKFTINEDLNIRLILEHSYSFDASTLPMVNPDGYAVGYFIPGAVVGTDYDFSGDVEPDNTSRSDGVYGIVNWQLSDSLSLKSTTGYRDDRTNFEVDIDLTNLPLFSVNGPTQNRTLSQEFVLSGEADRIDWIAGLNYYHNEGEEPDSGLNIGGTSIVLKSQTVETDAYAAFADLTYEVSDGLFLTLGGRYSTENKDSETLPGGFPPAIEQSERWNKFTPRAVVRYQFDDSNNLYASASRGFRSGAFTGFPPNKVEPESVDAYEIGFKHSSPAFDFTSAVFFYDYEDAQVTIIDVESPTGGSTKNVGNQRNIGIELELGLRPTPAWRIGIAAAYLDAEYRSFEEADMAVKDGFGGWFRVPMDATGERVARAPQWTGNLSTTYDMELAGGILQFAGNISLNSDFEHVVNDPEELREPGYGKVDLNISYTTADTHWRGEVYVTNLTDKQNAVQRAGGPLGTVALYDAPRMVGASLAYSF